MNRYEKIMARIEAGETIMIDGGTGTEIEVRGAQMVENAWNGGGALTDPDVVRGVHEDYIRAGGEVVISNTFSTSRYVLEDAGMAEHFDFLNRRGVELAVAARENVGRPDVLVAGGLTYVRFLGKKPPMDQVAAEMATQAAIFADAGADLIILEMMLEIDHLLVTLEAARKTGLPVWVGVSCRPNEAGEVALFRGETLAATVKALEPYDVPFLFVMHSEVENVAACLEILKRDWKRPYGVYAHSGDFIDPNWVFTDTISPEDYAAYALGWQAQGAQVLGGCCGIGVKHMEWLHQALTK